MSWTRTSTGGRATGASRPVSVPVTGTRPVGPTFLASQDTTETPSAPAGPDADRFEMPERGGIEQIGEGVEVLRRLVLPVIERVPVGSHHAAITPVTRLVRLVRHG